MAITHGEYVMRLTDFFGGFGGNLQEPLVFKFEESSEWVAPANGTVSITAAGGGGYGGTSTSVGASGGDTKITAFGGTLTLGGGVADTGIPRSGGQPSADSNWRFGLGNCYSGLAGMSTPNHPIQINVEGVSDGARGRSHYGGGGVSGASSFFGGSGSTGGIYRPGPGAAICVGLIFNVSAGDSILMEIGARADPPGNGPFPGNGVCIITFYGD